MAVLRGGAPAPRPARASAGWWPRWRAALVLGGLALLLLRHLYSPLQGKYGVGSGGAVVKLDSQRVLGAARRRRVRLERTSASAIVAGRRRACSASSRSRAATGGRRSSRRCGSCCRWSLLSVLTASSRDFAPERHLSFLLPGLRGRARRRSRSSCAPRRRPLRRARSPAAALAALLAPGVGRRPQRARATSTPTCATRASYMAGAVRPRRRAADDGRHALDQAEDPRLVGAYAVLARARLLAARRLAARRPARGCKLVRRLGQRGTPVGTLWLVHVGARHPPAVAPGAATAGADVRGFGTFAGRVGAPAAADGAVARSWPRATCCTRRVERRPGGLRRAPDGAPLPPRRARSRRARRAAQGV